MEKIHSHLRDVTRQTGPFSWMLQATDKDIKSLMIVLTVYLHEKHALTQSHLPF